ncbi:MAG: Arthrobacter phage vB ArS-ArV2 [Pseudomonadota bacterium]
MIDKTLSFPRYLEHASYGSSDLKAFKIGPPAMVPFKRSHRHDGTEATKLGTAAHCALLTPGLFDLDYWVKPEGMEWRSKENKQLRDDILASGKEIIDLDTLALVNDIAAAVRRKVQIGTHQAEWSIFWNCVESGLPCKGRPDWFDGEAVYDLKVSVVADKPAHNMAFAAHANGWLNQLAHNRAGLEANGLRVKVGRLVIVSPNAPHFVHMLEVRENDCDFLEMDNENTRRGMAQCHRTGQWPGTPDTWQTIELPASAAFTESDLQGAEEALTE